jgi:hypothetical protein
MLITQAEAASSKSSDDSDSFWGTIFGAGGGTVILIIIPLFYFANFNIGRSSDNCGVHMGVLLQGVGGEALRRGWQLRRQHRLNTLLFILLHFTLIN